MPLDTPPPSYEESLASMDEAPRSQEGNHHYMPPPSYEETEARAREERRIQELALEEERRSQERARREELRRHELAEQEQDTAIHNLIKGMENIAGAIEGIAQKLLSEKVCVEQSVQHLLYPFIDFRFKAPSDVAKTATSYHTTTSLGPDDQLEREVHQDQDLLWIHENIPPLEAYLQTFHAALFQLKALIPSHAILIDALRPHHKPQVDRAGHVHHWHYPHSSGSNHLLQANQKALIEQAEMYIRGLERYVHHLKQHIESDLIKHSVPTENKEIIACAIRLGGKVNARPDGKLASDFTPNWQIKLFLVEKGQDITLSNHHGFSLLSEAEGTPYFKPLLETAKTLPLGAVKTRDGSEKNILQMAIALGDIELMQRLATAVPKLLNKVHGGKLASDYTDNWEIKLLLVKHGQDITLSNHQGLSLLAQTEGTSYLRPLLETVKTIPTGAVKTSDGSYKNALQLAIMAEDIDLMHEIVRKAPKLLNSVHGGKLASDCTDNWAVKIFLAANGQDITLKGQGGLSLLAQAEGTPHLRAVLEAAKTIPTGLIQTRDGTYKNTLHIAVTSGDKELVQKIAAEKPELLHQLIYSPDWGPWFHWLGDLVYHMVTLQGWHERPGKNALHFAAEMQDFAMVEVLRNLGVHDHLNEDGKFAIDYFQHQSNEPSAPAFEDVQGFES